MGDTTHFMIEVKHSKANSVGVDQYIEMVLRQLKEKLELVLKEGEKESTSGSFRETEYFD